MAPLLAKAYKHPLALTLFLPIVLLLIHAAIYMPYVADDSLISLRYADRLLQGKGLTWNDGFPVEGYSNLSWILLNAGLGLTGIDLITSCRLLGIGSMILVLLINWFAWRDHLTGKRKPVFIGTQCLFAMAAPIGVWSIAGLEQPIVAVTLAAAIAFIWRYLESAETSVKYLLFASMSLGLLCITRPDGPMFSVSLAVAMILVRGFNVRTISHCFILAIFPLLMFGGQLIFRLYYYQDWVPNTAYAKVSLSFSHTLKGIAYVILGWGLLLPFSHFVTKLLYSKQYDSQYRSRVIVCLCVLLPWISYLIIVGGDIFVAFRHFIPIIVASVMIFPLADTLLAENEKYTLNNFKKLKIYAVIFLALQFFNPISLTAHFERWEWHGLVLSNVLKEAYGDKQPLFAVTAAGTLPYFSGFPSLDMLGLNDHFLARNPPESFYDGNGYIGHELGDGKYVMSKEPDLVSFCTPTGSLEACYVSGMEMQEMPEFEQEYTPVIYHGEIPYPVDSILWVRKYSEKVGVVDTGSRLGIPAYLFNNGEPSTTYLNEHRRLVVNLDAKENVQFAFHGIRGKQIESVTIVPANDAVVTEFSLDGDVLNLTLRSEESVVEIEKVLVEYKLPSIPLLNTSS